LKIAPTLSDRVRLRWARKLLQPHHWRRFRQPFAFAKKNSGLFLTRTPQMMTSSPASSANLPRGRESPASLVAANLENTRLSHRAITENRMALHVAHKHANVRFSCTFVMKQFSIAVSSSRG